MRPLLLLPFLALVVAVASLLEGCFLVTELCPDIGAERLALVPEKLSETGLFDDVAAETLAEGVREFKPQFELESDGAEKRRWFFIPDVIDTSDPDAWMFPTGTRFWKEFTKDDVRIETRLLTKVDDDAFFGGWVAQSYIWDDDDALAEPFGADNANGTEHDVPPTSQCIGCHAGRGSTVLGFSATQLAFDSDLVDLDDLVAEGALSDPVTVAFPGDDLDRRALGYLHGNCSHCHNDARPPPPAGYRCFDPRLPFDFSLPANLESVESSPLFTGVAGDALIRPDESSGGEAGVVGIMLAREMPALGSEEVDDEGVALLREWIARVF